MSDIQEQIKLAHKRAEENDIKLLQEELNGYKQERENLFVSIKRIQEENASKDYTIKEFMKANKELNEQLEEYGKYRDKEVVRLNNIIEELEKYINEVNNIITIDDIKENMYICGRYDENLDILDKLNELKEK